MSFYNHPWFPLVLAFSIIWTFVTVEVIWMESIHGADIDETDYCAMMEDSKTVEYCLIGDKIMSCYESLEQLLCKELAILTGDLKK